MAARRKVFTVLSAVVMLTLGVAHVRADDHPTANELLQSGLTQLEQGQLEQSAITLQRIDAVQLGVADQQKLRAALEQIRKQRPGAVAAAPAPARPDTAVTAESAPPPADEPAVEAAPEPEPEPAPAAEPAPAPAPAATESLIQQAKRIESQKHVAIADNATAEGNHNLAFSEYSKALDIDPNNEAAAAGKQSAQARLNQGGVQSGGGGSVLAPYGQIAKVREGEAKARYAKAMDHAAKAAEAGNYNQALDATALAKAIIDQNRQYLSEADYSKLREQALAASASYEEAKVKAQLEGIVKTDAATKAEQIEARAAAAAEQERKIQQLLSRAAALQRELNFEQSQNVLDELLFLDPNNVAGKAMKIMVEDAIIWRNYRDLERVKNTKIAEHSVENSAAAVPHTELITYPPDWPQLTETRLKQLHAAGGESEQDRRVRDTLKQAIPINFDGNRFENVVEYLRNVTGVNIVVNWRALEGAGIDPGATVTLNLTAVPADKAIRLILDQLGGDLVPLAFAIDDGVVTISTVENIGKTTHIRTYDIRDLVFSAPSFDDAPDFDLVEVTRAPASGGGGSGGQQQGLFEDQQTDEELPRDEMITRIQELIRASVDPDNWREQGGLISSMNELNGTLIISTTSENHRQILSLLGQLRETRAIQINVEARFLLVDQNYLDEIGFDMDVTWNPGGNLSPITFSQESSDIADRQNTAIPGSFGSSGQVGEPVDSRFTRGLVVTGGIIGDVSVDILIRATKANRRATNLSAPRITFFNGQRAYVLIATQLSYISDLDPAVGTDAALFDPEISVVSSGVVLDVEGTVSADRRYVTITARPSLARVVRLRQIAVFGQQGADNGADVDPDDDADADADADQDDVVEGIGGFGIIEAPELELTTIRTTVSVPDKGTLLLGGQRLVADIDIEAGIPVLSQLPILNRLFTNRSKVRDERTLLILIKPTILIQSEKEDELFPGLPQGFEGGGQ